MTLNRNEPAMVAGGATAIVGAVIALLVAFGLTLSAEQTAAIMGVVAVLGPLVQGYVTRLSVFSPASHEDTVEALVGTAAPDPDVTFVGAALEREGDPNLP